MTTNWTTATSRWRPIAPQGTPKPSRPRRRSSSNGATRNSQAISAREKNNSRQFTIFFENQDVVIQQDGRGGNHARPGGPSAQRVMEVLEKSTLSTVDCGHACVSLRPFTDHLLQHRGRKREEGATVG